MCYGGARGRDLSCPLSNARHGRNSWSWSVRWTRPSVNHSVIVLTGEERLGSGEDRCTPGQELAPGGARGRFRRVSGDIPVTSSGGRLRQRPAFAAHVGVTNQPAARQLSARALRAAAPQTVIRDWCLPLAFRQHCSASLRAAKLAVLAADLPVLRC